MDTSTIVSAALSPAFGFLFYLIEKVLHRRPRGEIRVVKVVRESDGIEIGYAAVVRNAGQLPFTVSSLELLDRTGGSVCATRIGGHNLPVVLNPGENCIEAFFSPCDEKASVFGDVIRIHACVSFGKNLRSRQLPRGCDLRHRIVADNLGSLRLSK